MESVDKLNDCVAQDTSDSDIELKIRGVKRKRAQLNSDSSSDDEALLPANCFEVEKNLHAAAIKNNLSEKDVKHIIKKVVTNDHVLALVSLQEEEENSCTYSESTEPKITRSKAKELMKSSPKSAPWNIELTPIKHIAVKTRPEVKALIAQDLPDESDEEYEPTHDDAQSDDDQTIESCSDVDSQPRTPATPQSIPSPRVVKDGPFKVPQEVKTPVRRILDLEEDATIARRTRSKLSLSATTIEHIESSFVPPDEPPLPAVDNLWNEFLSECLDPAAAFRNEDDDEADPEYNVAADPDAEEEDEESLERSILKISKKELSDLVTELFHIMPEGINEDVVGKDIFNATGKLNNGSITYNGSKWEGKREPLSDEDEGASTAKQDSCAGQTTGLVSTGKIEQNDECTNTQAEKCPVNGQTEENSAQHIPNPSNLNISIQMEEHSEGHSSLPQAPALLKKTIEEAAQSQYIEIYLNTNDVIVLPEQELILQQQLRQHIQLATCNFLQLYVHPVHWSNAPQYKEYLECLNEVCKKNPKSIANVCNLADAVELVRTWEVSVSVDNEQNKEYVEFMQKEIEKSRRRLSHNNLYLGNFHWIFQQVVANSSVFLYPYLLPPVPYRSDSSRRAGFLRSEDELIVQGLDQFWQYIEDNPELYKRPYKPNKNQRWGLSYTIELVKKHMFPWMTQKALYNRVVHVRKARDPDNPIVKFFKDRTVVPVQHKLLLYNPNINLYDQPEIEVPHIWCRYVCKTNLGKKKQYITRRAQMGGLEPSGVDINMGNIVETTAKTPLPQDFNKKIVKNRNHLNSPTTVVKIAPNLQSVIVQPLPVENLAPTSSPDTDIAVTSGIVTATSATSNGDTTQAVTMNSAMGTLQMVNKVPSFYSIVQTSSGAFLIPLNVTPSVTNTVNSVVAPVTSIGVEKPQDEEYNNNETEMSCSSSEDEVPLIDIRKRCAIVKTKSQLTEGDHCECCYIFKKICKRQTVITEFFKSRLSTGTPCPCKMKTYPSITNRLKILLRNFRKAHMDILFNLQSKLHTLNFELNRKGANKKENNCIPQKSIDCEENINDINYLGDLAYVTRFNIKLSMRLNLARNQFVRRKLYNILSTYSGTESPIWLMRKVQKAFAVEMPEMFKEFLWFVTEAQAEELSCYKDFFTICYLEDFVKRIEDEVKDSRQRHKIMSAVIEAMKRNEQESCKLCCQILPHLNNHPKLAKYLFSLFPHRYKDVKTSLPITPKTSRNISCKRKIVVTTDKTVVEDPDKDLLSDNMDTTMLTNNSHNGPCIAKAVTQINNNAEELSKHDNAEELSKNNNPEELRKNNNAAKLSKNNDEKESNIKNNTVELCNAEESCKTINVEEINKNNSADELNKVKTEELIDNNNSEKCSVVNNTNEFPKQEILEKQYDSDNELSDASMTIVSEDDDIIKFEADDWSREEDKQILEVLKETLLLSKKMEKTVDEILEEANIYDLLANSLSHKSVSEIKQRILYLLDMLILSETS